MSDAALANSLESWFRANARDLPWRLDVRDPYHALVSEFMLQQTQVSRVLEKYQPFIDRFPTVQSLASAPEDDVLASWAGLGYYRRARMLHACAKTIVAEHGSVVPDSVDLLLSLPGIGRYTAGAIASIVFNQHAPIVDGNVTRVLLRIHNKPEPQADKETVKWAWERAEQLVDVASDPACFNEAMMELGATICTPKNIRCAACPIRSHCQSLAAGTTESIPLPKPKAKQKPMYCASIVSTTDSATDSTTDSTRAQSVLVEQRPSTGMWASMYQVPTIERDDRQSTPEEITTHLGVGADCLESTGGFTHITTHRVVEFAIYRAKGVIPTPHQHYRTLDSLDEIALSNAQRKVLAMAGVE